MKKALTKAIPIKKVARKAIQIKKVAVKAMPTKKVSLMKILPREEPTMQQRKSLNLSR